MNTFGKKIALVVLTAVLPLCAQAHGRDGYALPGGAVPCREGRISGAGAVLGAITGAAIGSTVGKGGDQAAATVIGLLGGAVVGSVIEGAGPGHPCGRPHQNVVIPPAVVGYPRPPVIVTPAPIAVPVAPPVWHGPPAYGVVIPPAHGVRPGVPAAPVIVPGRRHHHGHWVHAREASDERRGWRDSRDPPRGWGRDDRWR